MSIDVISPVFLKDLVFIIDHGLKQSNTGLVNSFDLTVVVNVWLLRIELKPLSHLEFSLILSYF